MPTPVTTARQCLTDEAARALDNAVSVAQRRSHGQTTSLHAVSALLALPSSSLREACARARSCAYSSRLQFRALELCVSVSLDRIPVTKTAAADQPPVSNSLMAAIKRSQANQRRHPDTFYLYQQLQQFNNSNQPSSLSCVKVELKHFILSILDDPIVSRVFGDAGFRSCDLKFAILQPPPIARFARSRLPPLFLCNLPDSELDRSGSGSGSAFTFPFAGLPESEMIQDENNNRRIVDILTNKTKKNPLLIGASAKEALISFTECLRTAKPGILPAELDGLSLISLEMEMSEICEAKLEVRLKEIADLVEECSKPGTVINLGDLKKLIVESSSIDAVKFLVSRLTALLETHGGKKLWVIGAVESYENYKMFLAQFPWVEGDWDLQTLPITSSKPQYPKSRLIGSFVPLGGFFSGPTEFESPQSGGAHGFTSCELCNQKYEQESEQTIGMQPKDDLVLKAKLVGLRQKWNGICQRLHPIPQFNHGPAECSRSVAKVKENQLTSANKPSLVRVTENAESLGQRRPSTDLGLGCFITEHEGQTKNFKSICKFLRERVSWQEEAICQVSQAIDNFRSENRNSIIGRRHRGDLWLSFLGSDKLGKKKVAAALAEVIYGSIESLISVDLSKEDWAGSNIRRGKTVIDYISDELSRKPHSVVLLENVDKADFVAQTSLSRAISTGKFSDSHGREIGLNDVIFVTTLGSFQYTEEQIAKNKGRQIKRKQMDANNDSSEPERPGKKKKYETRSFLDLNLPADTLLDDEEAEEEEEENDSENCDDSWTESFLNEVHEKVVFKTIGVTSEI